VSSACWDEGSRRAQFRLECGEPGQCLPFLVYLRNYVRDSVAVDVSALSASCRVRLVRPSLVSAAVAAALKPTVRPGDRAMAVLVADRFRMTASVTCLERGREGDVIRVRASDGHIFRARVSGPGRLEALPQ
ncbi:MAG: flagella basal body P-ring formation protein FlgA, partial [Terriglobales bacterium]